MTKKRKFGFAFTEELLKTTSRFGHFSGKKIENHPWQDHFLPNYKTEQFNETASIWKIIAVSCVFLFASFGIFLKLFHLQVVLGKENRELANSNRVQMKVLHAPRGVIYDRSGKVLAENNPGFRLGDKFVSREQALLLEAKNDPEFTKLEVDSIRSYPEGPATAHVLGYVGEISADELSKKEYQNSKMGDYIGRGGIEQIYESVLKGKDGAEIIEVDASGKKLRTLREIEPIPGQNVYLSIDADLQKVAYQALQKAISKNNQNSSLEKTCCGAVVAEDPLSGEILALISEPSFDPHAFTDSQRSEEVSGFFTNESAPLFNRAVTATYPPGSTFKIASALAGLISGKISKDTQIEDTGVVHLGPYKFANWYFTDYGKTEGLVDVVKALQRSNDIYFYRVGEKIGESILGNTAQKLGFGKKLGIDLPEESAGVVPSNEWKKEEMGEVWYPGDTLHMSIGQGFLLTTPLQVLAQTSYIASGGVIFQPHLVTKITTAVGFDVKKFENKELGRDLFPKEYIDVIKKGLEQVPKEGGTAWPFFNFSIPTAGKTGTAEIGDPKGRTHAWYTAYAPVDEPKIALTVILEKGGQGSSEAAPVAKDILTWYFNPDKTNLKSLETQPVASASAKSLGE